jgi:hypothetical protein
MINLIIQFLFWWTICHKLHLEAEKQEPRIISKFLSGKLSLFLENQTKRELHTEHFSRRLQSIPSSYPTNQPSQQPTSRPSFSPTVTFVFAGSAQTFTVPTSSYFISVDVFGASGGIGGGNGSPGYGARVQAILPVIPGTVLNIYVGGMGSTTTGCFAGLTADGGFNGGGAGTVCSTSGGGASDIRIGGTALTNRIVVAGGGGGYHHGCGNGIQRGGDGGLVGGNGVTTYCGQTSGRGGTAIGGGGSSAPSAVGSLGQGGPGFNNAGGGGGGYYGG